MAKKLTKEQRIKWAEVLADDPETDVDTLERNGATPEDYHQAKQLEAESKRGNGFEPDENDDSNEKRAKAMRLGNVLFDNKQRSDNTSVVAKKPTEAPDFNESQLEDLSYITEGEQKNYEGGEPYKVTGNVTDGIKNLGKEWPVPVTERYEKDGKRRDIEIGKANGWDVFYKNRDKNKPLNLKTTGKWKELLND